MTNTSAGGQAHRSAEARLDNLLHLSELILFASVSCHHSVIDPVHAIARNFVALNFRNASLSILLIIEAVHPHTNAISLVVRSIPRGVARSSNSNPASIDPSRVGDFTHGLRRVFAFTFVARSTSRRVFVFSLIHCLQ